MFTQDFLHHQVLGHKILEIVTPLALVAQLFMITLKNKVTFQKKKRKEET